MKKIIELNLIVSFLIFIQIVTNAQTRFLNCSTNTPIQNAIVTNSTTNQWIGNTNENGEITIPKETKSILITHPEFGSLNINSFATVVCLDSNSTTLKELVIESGIEVKKQLLSILENSYKKFKKDNKGKDYYKIDFAITEANKKVETFNGILALGNLFSTTINNYTLYWNKANDYEKIHLKLRSFEYISHIDEAIFTDKKNLKKIIEIIEKRKVQKINNEILVYSNTTDDFITFTINEEKELISKYQNTEILKRNKPTHFSDTDFVLMGNIEVIFNTDNNYHINSLKVQEKYNIEDKIFHSNSFINQLKLTKDEIKKLNGKGVVGFAIDYVNQKEKN